MTNGSSSLRRKDEYGNVLILLLPLGHADRCTRKAFSTTVLHMIITAWDPHWRMLRGLSKDDAEAMPPARRWTATYGLRLLCHERKNRDSSFEAGIASGAGGCCRRTEGAASRYHESRRRKFEP